MSVKFPLKSWPSPSFLGSQMKNMGNVPLALQPYLEQNITINTVLNYVLILINKLHQYETKFTESFVFKAPTYTYMTKHSPSKIHYIKSSYAFVYFIQWGNSFQIHASVSVPCKFDPGDTH